MVDDNIVYDQQAAGVGGADKMPQVRECAPMRVHLVIIQAGIAMKFTVRVQHHG